MARTVALLGLITILAALVACSENAPDVEWEITIDGDVNQSVTYTYQDLVGMRRAELLNIVTRNPDGSVETTSWEGVTLFLLFREPGGVQYTVNWFVRVTVADGTSRRFSLAELRAALIALKDGEGNWLTETDSAPVRLIAPNRPSDEWLRGPIRFTVESP
jgi:DMSO/TMAO reductase YedYZ molybdopterin-dependent catalytic subunit